MKTFWTWWRVGTQFPGKPELLGGAETLAGAATIAIAHQNKARRNAGGLATTNVTDDMYYIRTPEKSSTTMITLAAAKLSMTDAEAARATLLKHLKSAARPDGRPSSKALKF